MHEVWLHFGATWWRCDRLGLNPSLVDADSASDPPPACHTTESYTLPRIHWVRWRLLWASLIPQLVKNLPAMKETWDRPLGWEDPLEKGKASHSSILAWRTVHGVTKSRRQLSDFTFFTFFCWVIWGTGHLEYWRHVSTSQFLKIRWPVFLLPGCPHTPQKKKFYSPPWHLENKKHSPIALCCKSYSSARALLWGFPCLPSTRAVGTGKVQRAPPCKYDSGFADKWGWQEPM